MRSKIIYFFMDAEIKKILEQNLELNKAIYKHTKYIKNYVFWAQIAGVIKILLIVTPIVLGIIYLPPLLENLFEQYKGLLGIQPGMANPIENLLKSGAGGFDLNNIDIDKLPPEIRKLIK